jgi:hypothetical protein
VEKWGDARVIVAVLSHDFWLSTVHKQNASSC